MESLTQREEKVQLAMEIAIKLGLLAIVIYLSYLIAKPFILIVAWSVILAVAISPFIDSLEKRFDHRKKIIIGLTVVVVAALLIPTHMISRNMFDSTQTLYQGLKDGNVLIPQPTEKVKEWPVIGEKSYELWDAASENLKETLKPFKENIKKMGKSVISALGSWIGTMYMFAGSVIIAAFFLMGKEGSVKFYRKLSRRVLGKRGDKWADLSTLTVRSVMYGILGVAIIQSTSGLIVMEIMGIPFALVWALGIMFLTIIQIPTLFVTFPVIAYAFSQGTGAEEFIFAIAMLIVTIMDLILKPMLLGRGLDVPMLVIFIGAIGGVILMGFIGLFVGAVVLALTYTLFGFWMGEEDTNAIEA